MGFNSSSSSSNLCRRSSSLRRWKLPIHPHLDECLWVALCLLRWVLALEVHTIWASVRRRSRRKSSRLRLRLRAPPHHLSKSPVPSPLLLKCSSMNLWTIHRHSLLTSLPRASSIPVSSGHPVLERRAGLLAQRSCINQALGYRCRSLRERKERRRHRRRQDSIGSVPLTITPASPEESESSSDDGGSHRTSRTSRRGPQSVGRNYLDPHHVPRPPSRRASPSLGQSGSRMSSPKVEVFDVATGGTIRVPSRVIGDDILEQEARDREEAERRRSVAMSMGGSPRLPNVPDMTPGRRTYSPLPSSSNMPPLPPSISPGGGNRMSMYGGGSARSRTSNLPSYAAAPSEVPYPGPVSPMPRMSFPPSSGNSTITPVIPGMPLGGGYAPAPLDGGAMYPGPITPVGSSRSRPRPLYDDAGRSPSASVVQLIGPRAVSPGAEFNRSPIILPTVPPLSRAASPNPYDAPFSPATAHPAQSPFMPSISPRPSAGATPFLRGTSPAPTHSRPPSRFSMAGSMARTDRIRPHELPGTQTYEAAPGAPMYPPPPTPARVPIPPSPAMSRRSTRSHVTSADPPGELTGAIFTRPPGGFSWENR
ncbi:hypothetical protein EXIGLDRAFT_414472 [Exidia glandulosa HHB12029]|uniref:Uncharacterized protein n=1 Tax=Exidia glandulosa HHB12029 TaxID=1314781 RepID=A0A165PQU4_EXIGL|nr:hypothetical protein EXIGLDRAFT_414472 [Exidia glandulosa HHB12029]